MTRIGKVKPKYMSIEDVKRERNESRPERSVLDSIIDLACWFLACGAMGAIVIFAMHYGS